MKWLTERLIVGMAVLALYAGACIVMSFFEIPEANRDAVLQLVGGVTSLAGLVVGWYFRGMVEQQRPHDPPFLLDERSELRSPARFNKGG